jgi:hypothetical protein
MTKLEKLKAAANAAYCAALAADVRAAAVYDAVCDDADASWDAHVAAWDAYYDELKKVRKENSND